MRWVATLVFFIIFAVVIYVWAAVFIANHDWPVLYLLAITVLLLLGADRTGRENRNLKQQIRYLENGLGL